MRRRRYPIKRRRKAPWYNRRITIPYTPSQIASSAWRGVQYLKSLVNSEVYKFDSTANPEADSTGSITHLTPIAQGDDDGNRTGNSILAKYLWLQLLVTMGGSATDTTYRVIVFIDRQQISDTTPAIGDVLEATALTAPLNNLTVGRFTILYDRVHNVCTSSIRTRQHRLYFRLQKHIRYNGAAGSDIQRNGVFLMIFSNEPTNDPAATMRWRIGYYDN